MTRPVAFVTGASRGIGAESAVALAQAGFDVAVTARTLNDNEQHEHGSYASNTAALPGSLKQTAKRIEAAGGRALALASDILEPETVLTAMDETMAQLGGIDLLFNNANYQGPGNMQRLLDVTPQQMSAIFSGNVFTPLRTVQHVLPQMQARGSGTIINMVSGSAINNPPAPPDEGGWGFAYPASKAALIRMVPSLRVECPGTNYRFFNVEPGFVYTDVMRANGLGEQQARRFRPTPATGIARVIAWLATNPAAQDFADKNVIFAPQLLEKLGI